MWGGTSCPIQSPKDKGAFIPACTNCFRPRLHKKCLLTEITSFPSQAGTDGEGKPEYISLRFSKSMRTEFGGGGGHWVPTTNTVAPHREGEL